MWQKFSRCAFDLPEEGLISSTLLALVALRTVSDRDPTFLAGERASRDCSTLRPMKRLWGNSREQAGGTGRGLAAAVLGFAWVLLIGCASPPPGGQEKPSALPGVLGSGSGEFSGEEAVRNRKALVAAGSRAPGSRSAARAAEWISSRLHEMGAQVDVWPAVREPGASGERPPGRVLVGRLGGEGDDPVVLAASYDTLPGERDGRGPANAAAAAGAAVVLEAGRVLSAVHGRYPVLLLFVEGDGLGTGVESDKLNPGLPRFPGSAAAASELREHGLAERVRLLVFVGSLPGPQFVVERDLRSHRMSRESIWQSAGALGAEEMFPASDGLGSPQAGHLAFIAAGMRPTVALVGRIGDGSFSPVEEALRPAADAAELEQLGRVILESIRRITLRLQRLEAFTKPPRDPGAGEPIAPLPAEPDGQDGKLSSEEGSTLWP